MTSAQTPDLTGQGFTVPVLLDLQGPYRDAASYALATLLEPLGLAIEIVQPDAGGVSDRGPGIRYGTRDTAAPAGWLNIRCHEGTPVFFGGTRPLGVSDVRWARGADLEAPVLFEGGWDERGDPVAASFLWLSGWNEFTNRERDRFGRPTFVGSLADRLGLGDRAPVDEDRERLAGRLAALGFPLRRRSWDGRPWALCPTHDIDYLKKWRPGLIWREGVHHLVQNRRGDPPAERLQRFGAFVADWLSPGDPFVQSIERMTEVYADREATATWFFKAGAHGPHDVPYRLQASRSTRLLKELSAAGHEVGLHPAFHAHDHAGYVRSERTVLARAAAADPVAVRTHYLRWEEPATPRVLADAGFRIDSTLGWSDSVGYRRGTCLPFRIWDHEAGRPVDLVEMPLALMESALFNRLGADLETAAERTRSLAATCRRHGGAFVVLWHNTLWDEMDYPGWGAHFVRTLDEAKRDGAAVLPLSAALDGWNRSV